METRAHHVLIGAFTLVVIALILLFAIWLGKASFNRQFHHYNIVFTQAVTGLSKGSPVQYNGIQVGEVSGLKLDPNDPRRVLARIRVAANTPIKLDTRAKLGMQGLTGGSFVQLTGGAPNSKPLMPTTKDPVPSIKSETSALSALLSSGSDVMTSLNGILNRLSDLVSAQNVGRLNHVLENLDETTTALASERKNLRELVQQGAASTRQLNELLVNTNKMVNGPGRETMQHAAATMASLQQASKSLNAILSENQGSLQSGLRGMDQLGPALRQMRSALHGLQQLTSRLKNDPTGFLLGRDQPAQFSPEH